MLHPKGAEADLQKAARMFKHALVGTLVLCFVATFLTMLYMYSFNSYDKETSLPGGGHGHGHATSHETPHVQETPGGAVMTPMMGSATPSPAADVTATPLATSPSPAPAVTATPMATSASPAASATP